MKPELRTALAEKGRCDLPGVLLAAAECAPLAKTGGLADVVGTLPKSLAALGFDARVITPYHRVIKEKYAAQVTHLTDFYIDLGWRHQYVGIERLLLDGIVIYLVDNEFYFGDRIYLGGEAEGEQYAFFARAILEALPRLDFTPEVLHCNDWHTAVLPMLMKTQYAGRMQSRMQTLLTIHNIAYQGKFSFEFVQDLLGIDARYYTPEFMELNGCANLLKAGCVFADHINTVSPSYAGEIRTAAYGEGLEGILNARQHQLSGILNGIDTAVFDPAHDSGITAPYSMDDMRGKAVCRAALCQELGLEIGEHTPIVAMVTRITPQKGFDLVQCVLDELMEEQDMAFVLLGTGNAEYEDFMRSAEWRHKGRLCAYIGYILHAVLVYSVSAKAFAGISPVKFFKNASAAMIFAFTSTSSAATLPVSKECADALGAEDDISSFVLPLGATINMDGTAIYQCVATVFLATCAGMQLTLSQMILIVVTATLASIGTAGTPGAGMIMLAMVLEAIGIPVAYIGLIVAVDRLFDMGRTCLNVTGDIACSLCVTKWESKKK